MIITIHQPQYMPWIGYFHKMASADLFVLLDDVQFKKNEWQHRNRIRNATGWQWLSVPNSYSFPQLIKEVRVINDRSWQDKHLKSIQMCYGRTPFCKQYLPLFEGYFSGHWDTIDLVSHDSITLLASIMGIDTRVVKSSDYGFEGTATERLVNICKYFNADTYIAGAGGKEYLDEMQFAAEGIAVDYQHFTTPYYPQHWSKGEEDFIANLSAIDLVFNCGPESLDVLMGQIEHAHTTL
ncbi:MAG: WbqC family protein [Chitinivibrionales bacterium]|nr:WbqC family protein [Chitinivibrionales bacterium]